MNPRLLLLSAAGAASCGVWSWAQPTFLHHPDSHSRPFGPDEHQLIRAVGSQHGSTEGPPSTSYSPEQAKAGPGPRNPGIRTVRHFLSTADVQPLLEEIEGIKRRHGINLISPMHAAMYRFQMSYLKPPLPAVNMMRITGRPEAEGQRLPAWGYGDEFREDQLPPQLQALVARVRSIPGLNLGPLRDVTINYRHSQFLRLDPHIDPALDGENVFIVGLDSDTVLTLCPSNYLKLTQALDGVWSLLTMADERQLVRAQAQRSWTSRDLDVLMEQGTLVLLSGDARWRWTHGTRLGVQPEGKHELHDWWGSAEHLVPRAAQRHSVVLAFARGPEHGD